MAKRGRPKGSTKSRPTQKVVQDLPVDNRAQNTLEIIRINTLRSLELVTPKKIQYRRRRQSNQKPLYSAEKLARKINTYFQDTPQFLWSIFGLCRYLEVSWKTLSNYKEKYPEYREIINQAREQIFEFYEIYGRNGIISSSMAKFVLESSDPYKKEDSAMNPILEYENIIHNKLEKHAVKDTE
jgi:hypothetical protein